MAPITAVQFCLNGLLQQAFRSLNPGNSNNDNERALSEKEILSASFGAGALSALFYGPVDLVTIQQQKLHSAPIATVRTLMKEYGTLSLFRGLGATIVREGIYTAGYLGLSPVIAHHLMEKKQNPSESESLLDDEYCYPMFGNRPFLACIVGACMAGSLSAILTHPADTAKTCVQSDMTKQKWPNARIALLKMWTGEVEGGTGRMWKGLGPRIMRLSGASYVCISFQEMAMNLKTEWSEVKF